MGQSLVNPVVVAHYPVEHALVWPKICGRCYCVTSSFEPVHLEKLSRNRIVDPQPPSRSGLREQLRSVGRSVLRVGQMFRLTKHDERMRICEDCLRKEQSFLVILGAAVLIPACVALLGYGLIAIVELYSQPAAAFLAVWSLPVGLPALAVLGVGIFVYLARKAPPAPVKLDRGEIWMLLPNEHVKTVCARGPFADSYVNALRALNRTMTCDDAARYRAALATVALPPQFVAPRVALDADQRAATWARSVSPA